MMVAAAVVVMVVAMVDSLPGVDALCRDECQCCMCECSDDNTQCTVEVEEMVGPGHYCCHPPGR